MVKWPKSQQKIMCHTIRLLLLKGERQNDVRLNSIPKLPYCKGGYPLKINSLLKTNIKSWTLWETDLYPCDNKVNCDTGGTPCPNLDKEIFFQIRFHLHPSLQARELASLSLKRAEISQKKNHQTQQLPLPPPPPPAPAFIKNFQAFKNT